MTKDIITNIISNLYEAGYIVVAICSDMGQRNMCLWSELNISFINSCFIIHPCNKLLKVFGFADVPHLIKLARNHLIDQGFLINNKEVNRSCFDILLSLCSENDLKIAHKLTKYHLEIKGSQRQKVYPAVQLFSNRVSKAIEWCGIKGFMENKNWQYTAKLVKMLNDWFDLFNSKNKFGFHPRNCAFGTKTDDQVSLLKEISQLIGEMRVGKQNTDSISKRNIA